MISYKHLIYICIAVVTVLLGVCASMFLPERFMYDAHIIIDRAHLEKGWIGSYPFTMMFYDSTGLSKWSFPAIALVQLPVVFFLMSRLKIPDHFYRLNLKNLIIWLGLLMYGVYVGFPSKEFITALYIYLVCMVLITPISLVKKILFSSLMLVFFGWFYRQYFILVPVLALVIYGMSFIRLKNRVLSLIVVGLITASFMSLSYGVLKGEFMSQSSREVLNKRRLKEGDANAATMIVSPVETDQFHGEVVGIVYGFFTVNLPISGLRFLLKPHVLAFVVWQLALFLYLLYIYHIILRDRKTYAHQQWVFHLLFAYFIIQGVFEPDLGSAVKHKLGVFPLIWLAMYYNKGLIKTPKIIRKYVFKSAG